MAGDRAGTLSPRVRFTLNGAPADLDPRGERNLLEVLRIDLGLTGTKYGCGEGECGACTVLLDGDAVRACQVEARSVAGREVVTVEGLAPAGRLSPVQKAFADLGAFQCGFCTPGMVVATTALLRKDPAPSEAQVREALDGNLCRCCGYARILQAVARASELTRAEGGGKR
jgi:aerobic-type carbon monoxide dehydrogenase small subunit (CoxS/CutS family)